MRAVVRPVLVLAVIVGAVVAAPPDVRPAAVELPPDLTITSVLPASGAVVGVAHPVVVTFSAPVTNRRAAERAVHVTSTPAMTGRFDWLDSNVVQWVPDRFWPAHSAVALSVGNLALDFKTGPAVLGVASISEHTFTVSIDSDDAGTAPRLPAPHHRPRWGEEGVLPASLGKPEFPTPVGTYAVISKDRNVIMDSSSVGVPVTDPEGYRLSVDYAVRITHRGLYVHSAPWALQALGVDNISHGCISLSPADAEWYFNAVNVGDPVIVQE
ncbi:Ig-like domain-containing protein [Mycobacterium sp. pUA109]|uniref:L,D-transpeptidase n=1 Tax=Mycobacterium sp. pUA109 TaxID=3238982 RepID=UPI00351B7079